MSDDPNIFKVDISTPGQLQGLVQAYKIMNDTIREMPTQAGWQEMNKARNVIKEKIGENLLQAFLHHLEKHNLNRTVPMEENA